MASLEKIVLLLGSDHPFEALAARDALIKRLAREGRDLHWFAKQADLCIASSHADKGGTADANSTDEIDHQAAAKWLLDQFGSFLSPNQRDFCNTIMQWVGEPTEKQAGWLSALLRKYGYRP
ncbi:hypothetical protein [Phyllobacterium lublinensis]|uniref:hypothetical protein n=1 Tax=Phyllobacterium lublinensis TaxID=2875708 RepID=UPI001CCE52BF|nr:hypothetical protein [Phyllobacterium sp. 2063]MBZ9654005.1 hypothetical protein [Phyllobacterium sp. 2063]